MADVTIFVLHPNEQYCQEIVQVFQEYDPELALEGIADLREAPNRVREEKPAAVVVGVDTPNDPALKSIETISNMPADVGIIVISKEPTRDLLVSCIRAGSDEFLEFPIDHDELSKAMGRLFRRKGIVGQRQGKVVAVFSPAGGVGVTTVACNLATGIAEELASSEAACVIDMNLQFGSVALAMDLREFSHTLADAVQEHERLDQNLLSSFMTSHASGAAVLPAPLSLQDLEGIDPWQVRSVIQVCRRTYDYVVLDMPHALDDCAIVGLDEADEIFLLCDMVLPSIRNTIHAVEVFRELEYQPDKLKLIINRFYDSDQVSLDEIVEHVKLPLHWLIPYDSRVVITSLNSGQMLDAAAPDSQATHSLVALAQQTAGIAPGRRAKKRRGLFSWVR
ncbi:MAG: AAA family ATPase [Planctomycetota bacterium]|jgi:pilus assembly protein CpaE